MPQMENVRRRSNVEVISEGEDFNKPNSSQAFNISRDGNCNRQSPASKVTPAAILLDEIYERIDHYNKPFFTEKNDWNGVQQNNEPVVPSHQLSLASAEHKENPLHVSDSQESSMMKANKSIIQEEEERKRENTVEPKNITDAPTISVETSVNSDVTDELGVVQVTDDSQNQTDTSNSSLIPLGLTQGLFKVRLAQRRPSREVRIPPDLLSASKEMQYHKYQEPQEPITVSVDLSEHQKVRDIITSWEQRLEHNGDSGDENEPQVTNKAMKHNSKGDNTVQVITIVEQRKEGLAYNINNDVSNNSTIPQSQKGLEDNTSSVKTFATVKSFPFNNDDGDSKESCFNRYLFLFLIIGFVFITSGLFSVVYLFTQK